MARLINDDPVNYAEEALQGFAQANARYVKPVYGGVVRSTKTAQGKVALVVGAEVPALVTGFAAAQQASDAATWARLVREYGLSWEMLPDRALTERTVWDALLDAVARQAPPRHGGIFRPKLRYAHQGGSNPPLIVIHGNALDSLPESYRRYLEHTFREVFKLQGTPLRVQFNTSHNPFATKEVRKIGNPRDTFYKNREKKS